MKTSDPIVIKNQLVEERGNRAFLCFVIHIHILNFLSLFSFPIMFATTSASKAIAIRSSTIVSRSLSSCEPAERLKCIFEEYRQKK